MIKKIIREYLLDSNTAVITTVITFFGITIFKCEQTTTNINVVNSLTALTKPTNRKEIKGFKHEN